MSVVFDAVRSQMFEFLLATVIALLTVLIARTDSVSAKDWLLTGLPAWLQAIGTLAAVYIAWRAFKEWRHPELARAKAQQAGSLLEDITDLAAKINLARFPRGIYGERHPKHAFEQLLNEKRRNAVAEAAEAATRLERRLDLALDERVVRDAKYLTAIAKRLEVEAIMLQMMLDSGGLDFPAGYDDDDYKSIFTPDVCESFEVFGWRVNRNVKVFPDALDLAMREKAQNLRDALQGHLQFRDAD